MALEYFRLLNTPTLSCFCFLSRWQMFRSYLRLFATIQSPSKRSWITWLRWWKKYLQRWESRALSVFVFQRVVWNSRSSLPLIGITTNEDISFPLDLPSQTSTGCMKTWTARYSPTCLLYRSSLGHGSSTGNDKTTHLQEILHQVFEDNS